jgi:chitinase
MHPLCDLTRGHFPALIKTRIRMMIRILGVALLLFFPSALWAAQVTLAWDPCDPKPDGYRVYKRIQGQSYDFGKPAWSGTQSTSTVANLANDTRYFFVVRAYAGARESGNSNEVDLLTPKANQPPIAQAGASQTVASASNVRLDGSGSSDPEGLVLSYQWIQTSGPHVQLSSATSATPTFTAPIAPAGGNTILVFELTVTDKGALTSRDSSMVHVIATQPSNPGTPPPTNDGTGNNNPAPPPQEPPNQDPPPQDPPKQDPPAQAPAPAQPIIYSPIEGAKNVSLLPWLTASVFSGGHADDTHNTSQWRITRTQDSKIVLDVTRDRNLVRMWVPFFILRPSTTYRCEVRYFDNHGKPSQWSHPVTFTTRGSWFGGSSASEHSMQPPAGTDLNANGIPDLEEADMIQGVQTNPGGFLMAVSIENSQNVDSIDGLAAIDPDTMESAPPVHDLQPYGLLSYSVRLKQPGQECQVTLHLSDPIDPRSAWIAYSADGEWVDCSEQVHVEEDGVTVVRTIVDGGGDDADGVANGVFIDLLAPRLTVLENNTGGDSGNNDPAPPATETGGGGCFIGSLFK